MIRFEQLDPNLLAKAKKLGFSDQQIGVLIKGSQSVHRSELTVRALRKNYGILPVIKQIVTLAAEFPAQQHPR